MGRQVRPRRRPPIPAGNEPLNLSALSAPHDDDPSLRPQLKCFETSLPSPCCGAAAWNFPSKASIATSFEIHSPIRVDKALARSARHHGAARNACSRRRGRNNYEAVRAGGGGLTIYQFDPSQSVLLLLRTPRRIRLGIREGQSVHRGQVIGYVGSTGNASPERLTCTSRFFSSHPSESGGRASPQSLTPFSNSPLSNCVPAT